MVVGGTWGTLRGGGGGYMGNIKVVGWGGGHGEP